MTHEAQFREVLDVRQVSGEELVALCPFHGDSSPSLWANRQKGLWTCYACGEGGSIRGLYRKLGRDLDGPVPASVIDEQFLSMLSGLAEEIHIPACECASIRQSQKLVQTSDLTKVSALGYNLVLSTSKTITASSTISGRCSDCGLPLILSEKTLRKFSVRANSLDSVNSTIPDHDFDKYLTGRSINARARELFELGWDGVSSAITIPYRTETGLLLGVVQRRLYGRPRYMYPRRFPRTETLFGSWLLTRLVPGLRREVLSPGWVVLCEGPFDVIKVWQSGVPAVGMWGSQLHDKQVSLLGKLGVIGVVIFTDRDSAGQKAALDAAQKLSKAGIGVRRVRWPGSYPQSLSDPGSLPEPMIRARVSKAHWRWPV